MPMPSPRFRLLVLLTWMALPGPVAASAGEATPGIPDLPEAAAPFGLAGAILPSDADGIVALFEALPADMAGHRKQPVERVADRIVAAWGEPEPAVGNPIRLMALHFPDSDFFPPDFTAGQYVAMACATGDGEATSCGRDGDLAWLLTETTASIEGERPGTPVASQTLSTVSFGGVDSPWLFSVAATTPEALEHLVAAFVAVAAPENEG